MKRTLKFATLLLCLPLALATRAAIGAQQTPPAAPPREAASVFSFASDGAFLGVTLKDVTAADVQSMKLPGEYGAIVARVEPGSPAAKCGLRVNDVIIEFGGMRVWSASQLADLVHETPPQRTVSLRISRAGEKLNLEAALASRTESAMMRGFAMPRFPMPRVNVSPRVFNFSFVPARYRLGIRVETLTSQLASYFGVKQGKGVLVTEVDSDGPAAKAGLKAGDCIIQAGSAEIASPSDLTRTLNDAKDAEITLSIIRSGREQTLTAKLEPASPPFDQNFQQSIERQIESIKAQAQSLEKQSPRLQAAEGQLERQAHALQRQAQALQRRSPRLRELQRRLQRLQERAQLGDSGVV
ncbi:MAG: PDZ domain-containing protein [Terriglobia bacterium]